MTFIIVRGNQPNFIMESTAVFILLCAIQLYSNRSFNMPKPSATTQVKDAPVEVAESNSKKFSKQERAKFMKELFSSMKQKNTGEPTDNIHVLAQQFLNSGDAVDLATVNRFIKPYGYSLSQQQFDKLAAIQPVTFNLPLDESSKAKVRSLTGTPKKGNYHGFSIGCYVFTRLDQQGKCSYAQYVGSSIVMANRLSNYLTPAVFKTDNREIIKSLLTYGQEAHTLTLYLVDSKDFLDPNLSNDSQRHTAFSLSRGLEQYLIFSLDPSLNTSKVAGGKASPRIEDDKLLKLYVYNEEGTELLYVSTYRAILGLGVIGGASMSKSMKTGEPVMGLLYSRTRFSDVVENLMSEDEFKKLLHIKKIFMTRKPSDKPITGRPSRVRLTDTADPAKPQYEFNSKSAATIFTKRYPNRVVHNKIFGRAQDDTFTHKDWLVEVLD